MTVPVGEHKDRIAAVVACAAAVAAAAFLMLAVLGMREMQRGQDDIRALLTETPRASRTVECSYTDTNGQTIRVSVQSEQGESAVVLAMRFKRELEVVQAQHPRR